MAAAVPALVVPALAGPVATAEAKRRPSLGSAPSLTLALLAQHVDLEPGGPAVRFQAIINEPHEGVTWTVDKLFVDGTQYLDFRATGS